MSQKVNNKNTKVANKSNNNRSRGKNVSKGSKFPSEECPKCGYTSNNPAWYTGNPVAAKKAGSINFSYPLGYNIDLDNPLLSTLADKGSFALPGMMSLDIVPSMGFSADASSALNLAAFKLYSFIRHENSGSRNYDAPDLLLYVAAVTDIYSYITWLQRTYLICNSYSVMNEYIPRAYCDLSRIDFEDVIANLADFAYQLDNRINKIRSFKVPGDMPIFQRRAFMFKDLYTEGESIKDQMYFYNPQSFYMFKLDADGAGMLETKDLRAIINPQGAHFTVDDLFRGLDAIIGRIAEQEDFGIMSGDILKAYGTNVVTLMPFDPAPGMGITPVRDVAVLEQIQNTTVIGVSDFDDHNSLHELSTNVVQSENKNYLITKPSFTLRVEKSAEGKVELYSKKTFMENRLLTSRSSDPSPEQVLESTRTMVIATSYNQTDDDTTITGVFDLMCGTEIACDCRVICYEMNAGARVFKQFHIPYALGVDLDAQDRYQELPASYWMLTYLTQFDYHPCVRVCGAKHSTTITGEVDWVKASTAFNTSEYTILS